MDKIFSAIRSNMLVQGSLFIIMGLFLILWPGVTIITVIYLVAALIAISGASSVVAYMRKKSPDYHSPVVLATGILLLLIALIAFIFPATVASFFSVALGVVLILSGVVCAVRSFELRQFKDNSWIVTLIVGILITIGGVVIILNPFASTELFILILGVLMLVNGICELFMEYQLHRLSKISM